MQTITRLQITFLSLCFTFALAAQPDIEWQTTFGGSEDDIAYDIELTTDGGYIVVGESRSADGDITEPRGWKDFGVAKLTANGELEWQGTYGGSHHDIARDVLQTTDGGYIVVGHTDSEDGQVSGHRGLTDVWVLKLSSDGSIEWERALGGNDNDYAYALEQTPDGGYYIGGSSASTNGDVTGNHGNLDYWVVRLSADGEIIWQNSYGGSRTDFAFSLDKTTDGGCILAGRSRSNDGDVTDHHGGSSFSFDNWVIKISATGTIDWERALGGTENDEGRSVRQTSDGGYIVAGTSTSEDGDVSNNNGSADSWIVKLDEDGNISWEASYGGFSHESTEHIRELSTGGYIATGCTGPAGDKRFWTIKITANGELDWQKSFGGTDDDRSFAVKPINEEGFIVAGRTASDNGDVSGQHGEYDFWVVKLGPCAVNGEVEIQDQSLRSLEAAPSSSYQWFDCSDGSFIEGEQSAIYSPELGGDYGVIVQNGTCIDTSECVSICPVNNWVDHFEDLLIADEDSPTASFQWINCDDESPIEGATEIIFEPTVSGTYAVIVTNGNCSVTSLCRPVCLDEFDLTIFINEDGSMQSVEDTVNTTFQWYTCATGSWINGANEPSYMPAVSGEYGVVIRRGVCSDTSPCFTFCAVDVSTTLNGNTISSAADPATSTYQWINCADGSIIPDETDASFIPNSSGDYAVIIRQGTCIDTSDCISVCSLSTDLTVTSDFIQAPNDSLTTSYQWIDCNLGTIIPGEDEYLFAPTTTGQYAAIITQSNCIDTSACVTFCAIDGNLMVTENTIFSQADTLSAFQWFDCSNGFLFQGENSYSFTPNASGLYGVIISQGACMETSECVNFTIVGTSDSENNSIKVFPNPARSVLHIEAESAGSFVIYDNQGVKLLSGSLSPASTQVDIRHLPAGLYTLKLQTPEGLVIKRFIKG